jgi:hypothetical protein
MHRNIVDSNIDNGSHSSNSSSSRNSGSDNEDESSTPFDPLLTSGTGSLRVECHLLSRVPITSRWIYVHEDPILSIKQFIQSAPAYKLLDEERMEAGSLLDLKEQYSCNRIAQFSRFQAFMASGKVLSMIAAARTSPGHNQFAPKSTTITSVDYNISIMFRLARFERLERLARFFTTSRVVWALDFLAAGFHVDDQGQSTVNFLKTTLSTLLT